MPNSIIKDKNIITITTDHNGVVKTYALDINKQCLTNSRNKVIISKPQGFVSTNTELTRELHEFGKTFIILSWILRKVQRNYIKLSDACRYLSIAEKIDVLGNKKLGTSIATCECISYLSQIKIIGLKPFLDWAKEKDYCFDYHDFSLFVGETKIYPIVPKEKLKKLDTFTKEIILNIANSISKEAFAKYYQRILYYIKNDHYIKYIKNQNEVYRAVRIFRNMVNYATTLECEIPKSNNLFETYNMLEKNYEVWKDVKDNKALAENQNKSYLNFAYGNYIVVVPTTAEEFRKEAFEQHNCIYSAYMPYVVKGSTNVVFIRKADQVDKSFITCEVGLHGTINQYLLAHNRRVEDKELLAFKELYQNHILNNINK